MAERIENISKNNRIRKSQQVTFGDVIYQPGGNCGPRVQSDFQIVIVHRGEADVEVEDEVRHIAAGHLGLFRPGLREFFHFSRSTETHHTWCSVAPGLVGPELQQDLEKTPCTLPLTNRMQMLVELGLSTPVSSAPVVARLLDHLGETLLREYLAESVLNYAEEAVLPEALRRAKDLVETEYTSPLTVGDLARKACCTPNHLTKLFRRHLGMTPARYLWQTRVNRGVELLRQTGLSISEIAYRTGFQTPFHFSRLVKELHQLAPKELRAKSWNVVR